jgi:FHA domain
MMEQSSRPARKVAIADHIWEAFEQMAASMGTDRDGLVNQAMFMFARLNGFLDGGAPAAAPRTGRSSPPVLSTVSPKDSLSSGSRSGARLDEKLAAQKLDDDPVRREVAERVLETAAELERLIKGKGNSSESSLDEQSDESRLPSQEGEADAGEEGNLYLMAEGGELDKIAKDRFVIGRGKHCDFVINSGKVSREHAVIVREGEEHYIEDLGSSNGTWFNKQRIKRRKIEDGDEYFICSEKIKLVMR